MNLILLSADQINGHTAKLSTRQHSHVRETLKLSVGDSVSVGIQDGLMGSGTITFTSNKDTFIEFDCRNPPPSALQGSLLLALPRPKMLKRVIQTVTAMGVKELYLINSWKVEKSYWQSPWLSPEKLQEQVWLGLEQAKDTQLPKIHLKKLFKPFVEDELPDLINGHDCFVAHPLRDDTDHSDKLAVEGSAKKTLAIGPEGGFTEYEVGKLEEVGFSRLSLGQRILRVENAVPVALSKVYPKAF